MRASSRLALKPLCLQKPGRTAQAEAKAGRPGPLDTPGQRPSPDVRRFFTVKLQERLPGHRHPCQLSIRPGKVKGQPQCLRLPRHLAGKHGDGGGGQRGGPPEKQPKGLPSADQPLLS